MTSYEDPYHTTMIQWKVRPVFFFAAQMCVPNIFVATTHQVMTILTQDHYHRISNEFATRLCQVCLRGLI